MRGRASRGSKPCQRMLKADFSENPLIDLFTWGLLAQHARTDEGPLRSDAPIACEEGKPEPSRQIIDVEEMLKQTPGPISSLSVQPGSPQRNPRYMVVFLSSFWSLEVCRSIKQQAPRDGKHRLSPNPYSVDKVLHIGVFI